MRWSGALLKPFALCHIQVILKKFFENSRWRCDKLPLVNRL